MNAFVCMGLMAIVAGVAFAQRATFCDSGDDNQCFGDSKCDAASEGCPQYPSVTCCRTADCGSKYTVDGRDVTAECEEAADAKMKEANDAHQKLLDDVRNARIAKGYFCPGYTGVAEDCFGDEMCDGSLAPKCPSNPNAKCCTDAVTCKGRFFDGGQEVTAEQCNGDQPTDTNPVASGADMRR